MSDSSYKPKVYRKQGGDELVVASGGKINIESGGTVEVAGVDLIAELAALNGLDATEVGYLNGVTAGTVLASKAVVAGAGKNVDELTFPVSGLKIGLAGAATAVSAKAAEINALSGVTAGTALANKAAVLGANKQINELALPVSGLKIGAGAGTAVTAAAAEINRLDGVTPGTAAASKAAVLGAGKNLDELTLPVSGLKIGLSGAATAVARKANEINSLVQGLAAGYKAAPGSVAATASAAVATGLATIVGFSVSAIASTATAINTAVKVSGTVVGGTLTVRRWKHTSAGTSTLVAATTAGTVSWLAIGT